MQPRARSAAKACGLYGRISSATGATIPALAGRPRRTGGVRLSTKRRSSAASARAGRRGMTSPSPQLAPCVVYHPVPRAEAPRSAAQSGGRSKGRSLAHTLVGFVCVWAIQLAAQRRFAVPSVATRGLFHSDGHCRAPPQRKNDWPWWSSGDLHTHTHAAALPRRSEETIARRLVMGAPGQRPELNRHNGTTSIMCVQLNGRAGAAAWAPARRLRRTLKMVMNWIGPIKFVGALASLSLSLSLSLSQQQQMVPRRLLGFLLFHAPEQIFSAIKESLLADAWFRVDGGLLRASAAASHGRLHRRLQSSGATAAPLPRLSSPRSAVACSSAARVGRGMMLFRPGDAPLLRPVRRPSPRRAWASCRACSTRISQVLGAQQARGRRRLTPRWIRHLNRTVMSDAGVASPQIDGRAMLGVPRQCLGTKEKEKGGSPPIADLLYWQLAMFLARRRRRAGDVQAMGGWPFGSRYPAARSRSFRRIQIRTHAGPAAKIEAHEQRHATTALLWTAADARASPSSWTSR